MFYFVKVTFESKIEHVLFYESQSPQFLTHVCCGQTARWIKMPLGTMVGLSPSDSVLDEDPAPSP